METVESNSLSAAAMLQVSGFAKRFKELFAGLP
jgi:hypothetical protein